MRPDARILLWLAGLAMATGVPLMFWFDTDASAHAAALPAVGEVLRSLHAASSALLVVGIVVHLAMRVRKEAPWRGVRTGALAFVSVAIAAITGALVAQTDHAQRLLGIVGLASFGSAVLWMAIVHIAYASLLVGLTLYMHVAKWGWDHLLGSRLHAALAIVGCGALALVLPAPMPGSGGPGPTSLIVPAMPILWAWAAVVAVAAYALSRRLSRSLARA